MSHQGYYLHPDTGKPVTDADFPLGITEEQWEKTQMEAECLEALQGLFPQLKYFVVFHSCGGMDDHLTLQDVITHLNDFHEWSFEDLADYLETLNVDLSIKQERK